MTGVECLNLGTEMKINSNCNSISYIAKLVRFPFPAFRFPFPICCFPFPSFPSQLVNVGMEKSEQSFQHFKWQRKRKQQQKQQKSEKQKREEKTKQMQKKTQSYEQHVCTREYLLEIQFSINAHKLISAQREREREREGAREWKGDTFRYIFQSHTRICRSIKCKTFQFTFCFLASNIRESCQKYLSRVCRVCERERKRERARQLSLSCFSFTL